MTKKLEINPDGRICNLCNTFLPWSDFSPQSNGPNGKKSRCKACKAQRSREYRKLPGFNERNAVRQSNWRKKNPELNKATQDRAWIKCKDDFNAKRLYAYHNDPIFRAKKIALDKARKRRKGDLSEDKWQKKLENQSNYIKRAPIEVREKISKTAKAYREELQDAYVLRAIMHLPPGEFVSPEILETKKLVVKIRREVKQLKQVS